MYRELQYAYIVIDDKNPTNHPIYAVEKYLGSCMLYFSDEDTNGMLCVEKKNIISSNIDSEYQPCIEEKHEPSASSFEISQNSPRYDEEIGVPGQELCDELYSIPFCFDTKITKM